MKIEKIAQTTRDGRRRISAQISWEDSDRPTREVFFEVDEAIGGALACDADPFVTAAIMPALWHGESRLAVDGELCPELQDGLMTAMAVIRHCYQLPSRVVTIEAKPRQAGARRPPDRAAFFFTGGIDSLATLRLNQLNYPKSNPGYFRDGLAVYGLEVESPEEFKHVQAWLGELAEHTGVNLLPLYTNERHLEDDWNFWLDAFEGAVLAAAGQVVAERLTSVTIASSYDVPNLHCIASHPMLDPYYSSQRLKVRHDGAGLSRYEKTRVLADWDVGLQYIRVCNVTRKYQAGRLNCGECEKCLRTMLTLFAFGALEKTRAFPNREFTADLLIEKVVLHSKNFRYWPELIAPMEQIDRPDLAQAIRYVCSRYRGEVGWRGAIRRFDRQRLNGGVSALKRSVRPNGRNAPRQTGAI